MGWGEGLGGVSGNAVCVGPSGPTPAEQQPTCRRHHGSAPSSQRGPSSVHGTAGGFAALTKEKTSLAQEVRPLPATSAHA